jgi:tetratricopeptide (TPR) repeat protein
LDPNFAYAYGSRGFAYLGKKDYDKAIADFEAALRIDPNNEEDKKYLEEAKKLKRGR